MADATANALLAYALGGKASPSAAPAGSLADVLGGSPLAALSPVLSEAVKDTPTNQTGQATSGGATRAAWNLTSGDFVIQSRSSGTATTGSKSVSQDASGSSGGGSAAGMPWWGWLAIAGAGLLSLFLILRR